MFNEKTYLQIKEQYSDYVRDLLKRARFDKEIIARLTDAGVDKQYATALVKEIRAEKDVKFRKQRITNVVLAITITIFGGFMLVSALWLPSTGFRFVGEFSRLLCIAIPTLLVGIALLIRSWSTWK